MRAARRERAATEPANASASRIRPVWSYSGARFLAFLVLRGMVGSGMVLVGGVAGPEGSGGARKPRWDNRVVLAETGAVCKRRVAIV